MQKRAQLLGHPFTFILTLIVTALIIVFGISVINDLLEVEEDVEYINFQNMLQREVNTYYNLDTGSTATITLVVPAAVNYICFVDQESVIDYSKIPNNKASLVRVTQDKNLFFIPYQNQPSINPGAVQHIKPVENPLCIKTIGKLAIKLTNEGNYVSVSQ